MKVLKNTILIFLITLNIFFNSGCWNFREIDKMAVVAGIAIDMNEKNNKYIVTVEIADVSTVTKEGGVISKVYSMEGNTIFEAIRDMIAKVGEKLFWSHAKMVVISDAVASKGVVPIIDWINRDSEVRLDMWMFVSKGSASDIFYKNPSSNEVISFEVGNAMKEQKSSGKFEVTDLWMFIHDLSDTGVEATVPSIEIITEHGKRYYDIRETGIFKNDKLIGWLNSKETQDMLILKNRPEQGILVIPNIGGDDEKVALEIFKCKTQRIPYREGNRIIMKVDVNLEIGVAEINGYTDYIQEDKREKLRMQAEKILKKDLVQLINKMQKQYAADVFGYGEVIGKKYIDYWNELRAHHDEIFLNTLSEVNVTINIKGSAKKSKVIEVGSSFEKNDKLGWNE